MKTKLIVIAVSGLISLAATSISGYAKEEIVNLKLQTKVEKGRLLQISWVKSELTILLPEAKERNKQASFKFSDKTKVIKDGVNISFSELMPGDSVIVEYYDDPKVSGSLTAISIDIVAPSASGPSQY